MIKSSKYSDNISQEHRKIIKILVPLFLIIALPFVLLAASQRTEDRQHASPFQNVNSSDGIGITNNPDGTMGSVNWMGNYANTLSDSQTGTLSFLVTDPVQNSPTQAQANQDTQGGIVSVSSLLLTISKVEVHLANLANQNGQTEGERPTGFISGRPSISPMPEQNGVWETLNIKTPRIVDLVELSKGSFAFLGSTKLAAGKYTEIRLYISSASAVLTSGQNITLEIPGKNNIVRVIRPFDITSGTNTTLTMDFDAQNSIINAGSQYILKPVISQLIVSQGEVPSGTVSIVSTSAVSISPRPTCFPRPACLDTVPRCLIAEPINGWCPPSPTPMRCGGFIQNAPICPTGYLCDHTGINPDLPGKCVSVSPSPMPSITCLPKPSCLTANPPTCVLPEPAGGWCLAPTGTNLSGGHVDSIMTYLNNILRSLLRTR